MTSNILKSKLFNVKSKYKSLKIFTNIIPIILIFVIWFLISNSDLVPRFMLPSPHDVFNAFSEDFQILIGNAFVTLSEAVLGLLISIFLAFILSFFIDRFLYLKKLLYPIILISQTIPTIAIAPILVLWFGYNFISKIVLIVVCCFFPITVSLIQGFESIDSDMINLMRSMSASKNKIFYYVKLPMSINSFFSGLKISASYSIISATVSEWMGGTSGLGVYMTKVKKSYMFDKMFASIFLLSIISLLLVKAIDGIHYFFMPKGSVRSVKRS